jgi:two-component system response regulator DesR
MSRFVSQVARALRKLSVPGDDRWVIGCSNIRGRIALLDVGDNDVGPAIKVLIAVRMGLLRQGLVVLLAGQEGIEVVADMAEADDTAAVLREARLRSPDVVVIDFDRSAARALSTVEKLRAQLPRLSIVALVRNHPEGLLRMLLSARTTWPALAVIDKHGSATQLVEAVRATARGELVFDTSVALAVLVTEPNPLTEREQEVLQLVANGSSNREISARLRLAPGTVRNYLSSVIAKTRARNRVDAVKIAQKSGWL